MVMVIDPATATLSTYIPANFGPCDFIIYYNSDYFGQPIFEIELITDDRLPYSIFKSHEDSWVLSNYQENLQVGLRT